MSIKDFARKIKSFRDTVQTRLSGIKGHLKVKDDLFVATLIVLVGTASFGLGKLSILEAQRTPISITDGQSAVLDAISSPVAATAQGTTSLSSGQGTVFGSRSGTKYYYPWCSGAARIKPENRVWFATIAAAKASGLTPAANCPGLN